MPTEIGEPVKVMAIFDPRPRPVKFRWRGRVYGVKEITYSWSSRRGSSRLLHFSVSDGASLFELVYDASSMSWAIGEVEA